VQPFSEQRGEFSMTISYFVDKLSPPSSSELESVMGSAFPFWERLIHFIDDNYQMTGELIYGGKNYGWNLWYRKSGKSLVSIYPQTESIVAQVVLGKEQVEKALNVKLGEKVGNMVRETPQLHDGKWLFIPVTTEVDVQDIEQLLLVKRRPVKRK
jgi:hypothetical protein